MNKSKKNQKDLSEDFKPSELNIQNNKTNEDLNKTGENNMNEVIDFDSDNNESNENQNNKVNYSFRKPDSKKIAQLLNTKRQKEGKLLRLTKDRNDLRADIKRKYEIRKKDGITSHRKIDGGEKEVLKKNVAILNNEIRELKDEIRILKRDLKKKANQRIKYEAEKMRRRIEMKKLEKLNKVDQNEADRKDDTNAVSDIKKAVNEGFTEKKYFKKSSEE
ncbi:MAG: hypothetical protein CMF23_07895 [Ignavibacteriae bacterium]|nr:hypothetical protein [Ignavibacteriota bacterium]